MNASPSTLIDGAIRDRIRKNYMACEHQARQRPIFVGGLILATLVAGAALFVDYAIISEFWTRALADEFLELPGSLATSVTFKSLQVLFATIAAHILFEHMGGFGRAVFVRLVFVLALMMLAGVGLLLALMSLPAGLSELSGGGAGSSLGSALSQLGLETDATRTAEATAGEISAMQAYKPVFWLASLGVIFLVVTGVAALCLHYALVNVRQLVAAGEYKTRAGDMAALKALEAEYATQRAALAEMEGPDNRRHLLWTSLMGECRSYGQGLEETQRAGDGVLAISGPGGARKSWTRGWSRKAQAAGHQEDRLRQCYDSQQIARYERLFDEWWDRRSRQAMGAGSVSPQGVREPFGEVLPPSSRRGGRPTLLQAAE